ncbi:MAG: sigma-54-dependent Fis family transcriptional regulator [Desulfobacteraceae bacterium]|nr:sigma-54-dependent Fis family transcriptional regulator [Desulfobacteraceae bacterium]
MPGQQILIIEESPRERMAYTGILESLGCDVKIALDGAEAQSAIAKGDFEMILADFNTPHFFPIRFIQKVKAKSPATELLFVSARPQVEEAVEAMKEGAFDFMVKPLEPEQLKLCATRILSGKKTTSQARKRSARKKAPVAIITRDPGMGRLLNLAERVADSSASVLIQGESGTGKELFARFIHEKSNRKNMPFVAVNCAALPEALLESELFGHEKGAFTGALARKLGKFELASNGTLFLDEITEMQFHLQAKLLRVLQEKTVDRVGGVEPVPVDVRVVATTNRDVKESISKGEFREDLYYRLNTIPLTVPPLRDRLGDLAPLCQFFIEKYRILDARDVKGMTKEALGVLCRQQFAGNIRELENIIHRAVLLADNGIIEPRDLMVEGDELPEDAGGKSPGFPCGLEPAPLKEMEEKMIFHTLDKTDGNRTHAAKILGISVRTLRNKLNEYKKTSVA